MKELIFEGSRKLDEKTEIVKAGLCQMQICTCDEIENAVDLVRRLNPSGTSCNWVLSENRPPVICASNPDRKHWILEC